MKGKFWLLLIVALVVFSAWWWQKYRTADEMSISIEEVLSTDYLEDPSNRSTRYNRYGERSLQLVRRGPTHFDFHFISEDPEVAKVAIYDVDLSAFIPVVPQWARAHKNLQIISLVDREWNRQQVIFDRLSNHIEVQGGDGFETENLYTVELARNCLNAGLFEIQFTTQERGEKALYYHGWFDFPLGFYKEIFEEKNSLSYWNHWFRLEHWFDPEGIEVPLTPLRTVNVEKEVPFQYDPQERFPLAGEQARKGRIVDAKGVRCWQDFCDKHKEITIATFVPPGRYNSQKPWGNDYNLFVNPNRIIHRTVDAPASERPLDEIEVHFTTGDGETLRLIVSGVDLATLPQIPSTEYFRGLYLPMGIGVGPFSQSYEELLQNLPYNSPYFSVLLNEKGEWLNHHKMGIDGPVLHRDVDDPTKIHLYFLSYERAQLFGHYIFSI